MTTTNDMTGTERMAEGQRLTDLVAKAACRWRGYHEPDRAGMCEVDAALYDAVDAMLAAVTEDDR